MWTAKGWGGVRAEKVLDALETVLACEEGSAHGWVLDTVAEPLRPSVRGLARQGLVEQACPEKRAELSAWEGRPVLWAVRLSPVGHDLLAYARTRPVPVPSGPAPDEQRVDLLRSQMEALRVFVGMAEKLRTPVALGLAEQVRKAVRSNADKRWQVNLTPEQMVSVAYGFWLHGLTGSVAEANRFGREYGVVHQPDQAAGSRPEARRETGSSPA